jgi:molybdenum cofactor cytidylyltransferase
MLPGVVLAAGSSTRMGRPKANLPIGTTGDTFLTHIVATLLASGIDDVVVVVGHERDAVVQSVSERGLTLRFVENADYAEGQLSSLLAGLRVVDRPGVTGMLVTLVDVPFVSAETVRAVVARYRTTRARIVRPARGCEHGHPMIFDRSMFDLLRRADPDAGAKPVVRAHATPEGEVAVGDDGAFTDIDTPEEYARAVTKFAGGSLPGGAVDRSKT